MTPASPARRVRAVALVGLLASLPLAAGAQVYKCPQAGGSTSYQSTPCASATRPAARPTAAELNAARQAQAQAPAAAGPVVDPYATAVSSRPRAPGPLKPSVPAPPRDGRITSDEERRRACTIALNNEAVLARGRKAYSFDKDGNQNTVLDTDRARLKAEADHVAATTCR